MNQIITFVNLIWQHQKELILFYSRPSNKNKFKMSCCMFWPANNCCPPHSLLKKDLQVFPHFFLILRQKRKNCQRRKNAKNASNILLQILYASTVQRWLKMNVKCWKWRQSDAPKKIGWTWYRFWMKDNLADSICLVYRIVD